MRQIHLGQMARMAALFAAPLLLSSCLLFFRDPKLPKLPEEKYNINEDSSFFSKMPPYSEEGKNIVAFEIDGKPYVYPKAGAYQWAWKQPPQWNCYVDTEHESDSAHFVFDVTRRGQKYNNSKFSFSIRFPESEFEQLSYGNFASRMGFLPFGLLGPYYVAEKELREASIKINKLDLQRKIIAGTFEGKLRYRKDTTNTVEIENGFFDVRYSHKSNRS